MGGGKEKEAQKILEEALLGALGGVGHGKAKVLVIPASSGAYS